MVYKPKLLISFISDVSFDSLIAAKITLNKIIVSERGDPNNRSGFRKLLSKWTYLYASIAVFQSSQALNLYPSITNGNIIKNYLPTISPRELCFDKHKIITVGELTKAKNISHSIIAFSFLIKKFPWLKYEIFGNGKEKHSLSLLITNQLFKGTHNKVNSIWRNKITIVSALNIIYSVARRPIISNNNQS